MKRFLLTAAAVLILLLACFAGYVQYRKWASFRTPIHRTATAVIRVNALSMAQSLIPDYLGFSRRGDKEKRGKREQAPPSGIELPANLFIYTVSGKAPTTLFTRLELGRVSDFRATMARLLPGSTVVDSGTACTTIQSADRRLTVAYTSEAAALAWSPAPEPVADILGDILFQRHMMAVNAGPFRRICALPGHVVYLDGRNEGALNFRSGAMTLEATLSPQSLPRSATLASPTYTRQPALEAYLNADARALLSGRTWTVGPFRIPSDSLLRYYGGQAAITIDSTTPQQETVVTYGYNDNFEKVARTETRAIQVPLIRIRLSARPGLYAYLVRQGIVQPDSGTVSRECFPLYQLYARAADSALILTTASSQGAAPVLRQNKGFAGLEVRFDVLKRQQLFPALNPYIQMLRSLTGTARLLQGNRVMVRAELTFEDRERNALLQLADNL